MDAHQTNKQNALGTHRQVDAGECASPLVKHDVCLAFAHVVNKQQKSDHGADENAHHRIHHDTDRAGEERDEEGGLWWI